MNPALNRNEQSYEIWLVFVFPTKQTNIWLTTITEYSVFKVSTFSVLLQTVETVKSIFSRGTPVPSFFLPMNKFYWERLDKLMSGLSSYFKANDRIFTMFVLTSVIPEKTKSVFTSVKVLRFSLRSSTRLIKRIVINGLVLHIS